jgi:hypothetical protein
MSGQRIGMNFRRRFDSRFSQSQYRHRDFIAQQP